MVYHFMTIWRHSLKKTLSSPFDERNSWNMKVHSPTNAERYWYFVFDCILKMDFPYFVFKMNWKFQCFCHTSQTANIPNPNRSEFYRTVITIPKYKNTLCNRACIVDMNVSLTAFRYSSLINMHNSQLIQILSTSKALLLWSEIK